MLDAHIIKQLISQNSKIAAIKYVIENSNFNLVQGKNIVEAIEKGQSLEEATAIVNASNARGEHSNSDTTVRVVNRNGVVNITYIDENGNKTDNITPNHPLWSKVKTLMHNNPLVQEMERTSNPLDTSSTNTSSFQPIIQESSFKKNWVIIIGLILILASLAYTILH